MRKKKNGLPLILLIIIVILAVFGIYKLLTREKNTPEQTSFVQTLEDGTKQNTSDKLKEKKNVNGIEFDNIALIQKNDDTIEFSAIARNATTEKIDTCMLQINFLSSNEEVLATSYMYLFELETNASSSVSAIINDLDVSKVYNAEIVKLESAN